MAKKEKLDVVFSSSDALSFVFRLVEQEFMQVSYEIESYLKLKEECPIDLARDTYRELVKDMAPQFEDLVEKQTFIKGVFKDLGVKDSYINGLIKIAKKRKKSRSS